MSLPGADLAFIDDGGDKLPVVFLHAFPYHSAMWEGQRAVLRNEARFIALDARGVGKSRVSGAPFMLEHLVDDVIALLDRLSIERAVLCGLSMGGYVALRTVQRAPERVLGLLLADTQAASDGNEAKLARADGLRMLQHEGVQSFARLQLTRQLSSYTQKERPQLAAALEKMAAESTIEGVSANLVALATRTDQTEALAEIKVPTRIIVGADDGITQPSAAEAMAAKIPGADLHVLERVGHLSNLEAEQAFNSLLLEHLAKLRG